MDRYLIIWPERRWVSGAALMVMANDDIANRATSFTDEVKTVADALAVLHDSGTVTLAKP